MPLSKIDTRTINMVQDHLKGRNFQSVKQLASAFIRSAMSSRSKTNRLAALRELGVIIDPAAMPMPTDVTFAVEVL